jgi:uncharacterized membrane protein
MTNQSTHADVAHQLDLTHLTRTEFTNALVHLYRGELGEAATWRSRIDTTSHWAVILSATALTFVFSENNSEHQAVIPIISIFCTFFLLMEARRYRFFDIWRSRARMIEINFYRPMLDRSTSATPEWTETLAHDMEWPHFHMPWWEAVGRRLRRNYQWIYAILLGSWIVVLMSPHDPSIPLAEIVARASIGPFSGQLVLAGMLLFYGALAGLGIYSYRVSHSKKALPAGHPGRLSKAHHEEV